MTAAPDSPDWKRLGQMLLHRRIELDVRYRNLTLFCEERRIDYRVAWDLEHGARSNYRPTTILGAEAAYGLAAGSIDAALAGGELVPRADQPGPLSEQELAGFGLTGEQIRAFRTLPPDMQLAFRAWGELGRGANDGDRKRALPRR